MKSCEILSVRIIFLAENLVFLDFNDVSAYVIVHPILL